MKVNPQGDGTRGPARMLDILPDTHQTIAVEVQGRKLPLKLVLDYDCAPVENAVATKMDAARDSNTAAASAALAAAVLKKRPVTAKARPSRKVIPKNIGDLQVFSSSEAREPDPDHCTEVFNNPRHRILIRNRGNPNNQANNKKIGPVSDNFEVDFIYLSFYSVRGCQVGVSC